MKVLSKEEWKRRRKIKRYARVGSVLLLFLLLILVIIFGAIRLIRSLFFTEEVGTWTAAGNVTIKECLLTPSDFTRPRKALDEVQSVVIHFSGVNGQTAIEARNMFEQLRITEVRAVSMHFVVGFDGEIVQCIPVNEISYGVGERNATTISIAYCHLNEDGKIEDATYDSLVKLTAKVCKNFNLQEKDILRCDDINHNNCPPYLSENEEVWLQFKKDVMEAAKTIEK